MSCLAKIYYHKHMTRDDWFFSVFERVGKTYIHAYIQQLAPKFQTAYPNHTKIHPKYFTWVKRNSIHFCVYVLVVRLFIYHYSLICRRFKFNIFNMNMCRHNSSNNNSSGGIFQNWIYISFVFFGAHMLFWEQKLKEPKRIVINL